MKNNEDPTGLDALLAADVDEEMRPGFDTRFHARLAELKATQKRRRFQFVAFAMSAAVAASLAIGFTLVPRATRDDPTTGLEIALEYELYENYDVVKDLPDLEVLELLASADGVDINEVQQ